MKPGAYFDGAAEPSRRGVWHWWSKRRWRYNRDLCLIGAVSWVLV